MYSNESECTLKRVFMHLNKKEDFVYDALKSNKDNKDWISIPQ